MVTPFRSSWSPDHLAALSVAGAEIPLIGADDARPVLPGYDLWDLWPLQAADGSVARVRGDEIWICLAAPVADDPEERHKIARTRFLVKRERDWVDCGTLFPDGLTPGSREWSGSAVLLDDGRTVVAYLTAAGRRGESEPTFEQRLFLSRGTLTMNGERPTFAGWTPPVPVVENDGECYRDLSSRPVVGGLLKAFRDPSFFVDPQDRTVYMLFAASLAQSRHPYDGAIGIAVAASGRFEGPFSLLPPVVAAEGVANELERPHMIRHAGTYYLFWSTHGHMLAPDGRGGPTGLYGMVGASPRGPFAPLNGSGLVLANPAAEPTQGYCWQVLDTLEVVSFVNYWGMKGRSIDDPDLKRAQFGGTFAPRLRIRLDGSRACIVR